MFAYIDDDSLFQWYHQWKSASIMLWATLPTPYRLLAPQARLYTEYIDVASLIR